jgi:uncharacterized protein
MTSVSYPGVYMQEVPSGVRPIQAAGTSTAAFIGVAEQGAIGVAQRVFSFTEFTALYGGFLSQNYLAHGVFQFFNNGGTQAYVVRVARDADTAEVTLRDRAGTPRDTLVVRASSPGRWGNNLQLRVITTGLLDPENTFDLEVSRFAPGDDEPVVLERFEALSMDPAAPRSAAAVVNSGSAVIRVEQAAGNTNQIAGFVEGTPIPGPGDLLGANQRRLRINLHGDGLQEIDLTAELAGDDLSVLENIRAALQTVIREVIPLRNSTPARAYPDAAVTIAGTAGDRLRITSGVAAANSTVEVREAEDLLVNAAGPLGLGSGARVVGGSSDMRPPDTADGVYYLVGDALVSGAVSDVHAGDDGETPQDLDYINAMRALDTILDVSLLAVPGVGSEAVADAGMNYCRTLRPLSDMFYIADMAPTDDTLGEAEDWRDAINVPNSHGAVYFPWLRMLDPAGGPEPVLVPPSGYIAGVSARTDARRGVWTSPAGLDASVSGAIGLATDLTDVQQGVLNIHPKSVCVIRRFPAAGMVVWGARTLSSDPEYRYIAPRRMAIFLRVSIFNGIQWAVFQPNDDPLWAQLRLNLNAFMTTLFRQGAFQGATASEAYFVKVDKETTTQADIDNGVVNILVGFAPLKPAEFVVVKISQIAGRTG